MTYTTQQLQGMSDFQHSIAIAEKMGWEVLAQDEKLDKQIVVRKSPNDRPCFFDCNNHNDIMPLAFERNVSIVQSEADRKHGQWCAFLWHTEDEFNDVNPLRAIACLLLMMED